MRRRPVLVSVLLLLAGTLGGAAWWARTDPERARQFLEDRGVSAGKAAQAVSWISGQPVTEEAGAGPVRASGSIEGEEVAIVSEFAGQITRVAVEEGDEVRVGQVLVELDTGVLQAQLAQARAAVVAAEANLQRVRAGTHPAEILAAEAAVQKAKAERDAAQTAWQDAQAIAQNPQELDAQIAQAEAAVQLAAVQIEQAQAQVAAAEVERDRYRAQGSLEEKGLYRVYQYQVEAASAAVEAAKANKAGAEERLAGLRALRAHPLVLLSQVHVAESRYRIAEAGVQVAEAKLAELQAGPTAEEVHVAEAQLAKARATVSGLQLQIEKRILRSPIDGIVTGQSAHAGEPAVAGVSLLTVADLQEVLLTVYIPVDQLGRVMLGQEVQVEVDSFPGRIFRGMVSFISQEAEFTPKNVQTDKDRVNMVFAVRIRVPNPERELKPGMPADVTFGSAD